MTRRPRDLTPYLAAEYARQHPMRPPKEKFSDETLAAVSFIMRQIDPEGTKPIILPPMPAEDYEPQPTAKGKDDAA